MAFYTQLYSPESHEAFARTDRTITGVRANQRAMADRLKSGDYLICYMTAFSRWVGLLRVTGETYFDPSPLLYEDDPFVQRIPVYPEIWLPRDRTIPIHDRSLWGALSFTRHLPPGSSGWTGKVRRSLYSISEPDAAVLIDALRRQAGDSAQQFPIDEDDFNRAKKAVVRSQTGVVSVSIPEDAVPDPGTSEQSPGIDAGGSAEMQALLARIGEQTGHRVWLPRNDRSRVLAHWRPDENCLLDQLPLSYDDATIKTIENIDVLWIRGRTIRRAFEVEHSTAIYSGLLRMADLLALQGNMQIPLHIVAPDDRADAVMKQLTRPVFALLEGAPLAERCSFIPYSAVVELSGLQHLDAMRDDIVDRYGEYPE